MAMKVEDATKSMQQRYGEEATARLYSVPQDYGKCGRGPCTVRRPDRILIARWFAGETFEAAMELAAETEEEEAAVNEMRRLYGPSAGAQLVDVALDLGEKGAGRCTVTRPGDNGLLVFAGTSWSEALAKAAPPVIWMVTEDVPAVEETPVVEDPPAEVVVAAETIKAEEEIQAEVEKEAREEEIDTSDIGNEDGEDLPPSDLDDIANFED